MKNNRIWKNLLLMLLPLLVLAVTALLDPHIIRMEQAWRQITPLWLAAAFACTALYWIFDATTHWFTARAMHCRQSWPSAFLTGMVGIFYNALTPFAMGGQPMQVLQMRKQGIPTGTASSLLVFKFFAWQVVTTLLGTLGLILYGHTVTDSPAMTVLFLIGYALNAGCLILAALALVLHDRLARCGRAVLRFLARIRLIKTPESLTRYHNLWDHFLQDYRQATRFALDKTKRVLPILLFAALTAVATFSVTYCVYRGLGLGEKGYGTLLLMQALLSVSVSYIPLPGASVASEGGFYLIFSRLFPGAYCFPGMLLWRIFTYYIHLPFGFAATVADGFLTKPRRQPPEVSRFFRTPK